jgi:hypothetical protein
MVDYHPLPQDDGWSLPRTGTMHLTRGELLCLDFFLCGDYMLKLGYELPEVAQDWDSFRAVIYLAIYELSQPGNRHLPILPEVTNGPWPTYPIKMVEDDAKFLFMFLPPSFKWGTGGDEGHSLKMKLTAHLFGLQETKEARDASSPNEAESVPKDPPTAEPDA